MIRKRASHDFAEALGDHWVTTDGSPADGYLNVYHLEGSLGNLPMGSQPNTQPLYSCMVGVWDQMVSTSSNCEGQTMLGVIGYVYTSPPSGVPGHPVYRCYIPASGDHFASTDSGCEGKHTDYQLGWALG